MDAERVKWVRSVVWSVIRNKNLYKLDNEELMSAGMEGYAKALATYDESLNDNFMAYACQKIKWSVLDEVRFLLGDARNPDRPVVLSLDIMEEPICLVDEMAITELKHDVLAIANHLLERGEIDMRDLDLLNNLIEGNTAAGISSKYGVTESAICLSLKKLREKLKREYSRTKKRGLR